MESFLGERDRSGSKGGTAFAGGAAMPDTVLIGRPARGLERRHQSDGESRLLSELALPCICTIIVSIAVNCVV
ncbi:hypothetical protein GCM10027400_00900 [Pseudoxanthomonas daejeonensis]